MPPKKRSAYTKSTNEAPSKRSKPSPGETGKKFTDDSGSPYWEIGGNLRRVTVSEFKGSHLVSIREHYEKDGKTLPAKKGISLSIEQFNTLLSILPQIEGYLAEKKVSLIRPTYGGPSASASKNIEKEEDDSDNEEVDKDVEEELEEEEEEVELKKKPAKKAKKVKDESEEE